MTFSRQTALLRRFGAMVVMLHLVTASTVLAEDELARDSCPSRKHDPINEANLRGKHLEQNRSHEGAKMVIGAKRRLWLSVPASCIPATVARGANIFAIFRNSFSRLLRKSERKFHCARIAYPAWHKLGTNARWFITPSQVINLINLREKRGFFPTK